MSVNLHLIIFVSFLAFIDASSLHGAQPVKGKFAVTLELPTDTKRMTLVINNEQGKRVRNLIADTDPTSFEHKATGKGKIRVTIPWDGRDESGTVVAPGAYQVEGLVHQGLEAILELPFYNPGTPPWPLADGSGGWLSDTSPPMSIAAFGDWVVLAAPAVDEGDGVIGIFNDGRKKWGLKMGADTLDCDEKYVYYIRNGDTPSAGLYRINKITGAKAPIEYKGKLVFPLPLSALSSTNGTVSISSLSAHWNKLTACTSDGQIILIEPDTGEVLSRTSLDGATHIAYSRNGKLFALASNNVFQVSTEENKAQPIPITGLINAKALAIDNDGNIVVADDGPDQQIKIFDIEGHELQRIGKKGGRPDRGALLKTGLYRPSSIAVDGHSQIWVVEYSKAMPRVSVWDKNGKLVREYIGGAGTGGRGLFLHDQNPNLAYCGAVEVALDRKNSAWSVNGLIWNPDLQQRESFNFPVNSDHSGQRFTSSASGKPREYCYFRESSHGTHVFMMRKKEGWKPVSAIGHANSLMVINSAFLTLNPKDGFLWNDQNENGLVDPNEVEVIPAIDGKGLFSLENGPGGRVALDFTFFTSALDNERTLVEFKPVKFTDAGAPVYTSQGIRRVPSLAAGDLVPVTGNDLLINLTEPRSDFRAAVQGIHTQSGDTLWSININHSGLQGATQAALPKQGEIPGALKICGVAPLGSANHVFLLRGTTGQDYLITSTGLIIGSLFSDGRLPHPSFPNQNKSVRSLNVSNFSNGAGAMNGWFGKHSDGKYRLSSAFAARQTGFSVEVRGLDKVGLLKGPRLDLSASDLAQLDSSSVVTSSAAPSQTYLIRRLAEPFKSDGKLTEWKGIPDTALGSANSSFRLGYSDRALCLLVNVKNGAGSISQPRDYTKVFESGDAIDFTINVDSNLTGSPGRQDLKASDFRFLFTIMHDKPSVILMRPLDPNASASSKKTYQSDIQTRTFDMVDLLKNVPTSMTKRKDGYYIEAAIPFSMLGIKPAPGLKLRGNIGIIERDDLTSTIKRDYWSNKNLKNPSDTAGLSWLYPVTWDILEFQ